MIPIKYILIPLGTLSLFLGIVGIFIPGLPTTPFLLITAGLYYRSSDKLYKGLISNRFLSSYILRFHTSNGMTRRVKLYSISMMWAMILCSSIFFIATVPVKIIVLFVGIIGTLVMGFLIPTIPGSDHKSINPPKKTSP